MQNIQKRLNSLTNHYKMHKSVDNLKSRQWKHKRPYIPLLDLSELPKSSDYRQVQVKPVNVVIQKKPSE